MDPLKEEKTALRRRMRRLLSTAVAEEYEFPGEQLAPWLESGLPRAETWILGFAALPGEPDPLPLLKDGARRGCRIWMPRVQPGREGEVMEFYPWDPGQPLPDKDLYSIPCPHREGRGVREILTAGDPVPETALVLVPGLAFDLSGGRLGRGKGFYDRFLSLIPPGWRTLGLALPEQVVPQVPAGPLDRRLDGVLVPLIKRPGKIKL